MSTDKVIDNNLVSLMGVIESSAVFDHEVYGEGFYTFTVSTSRLSDSYDILPITISDRLIERDKIIPGKGIHILGQLRSYNNYSDKKNRLVLTVFARGVTLFENTDFEGNPNIIELNGFICKKPVYRVTPFGREICDVLVAVNRAYNKSDYIPCIAWGRNAKYVGKMEVGEAIKIKGRIQSRKYQKKTEDGVIERIAYEVSVSRIEKSSDV